MQRPFEVKDETMLEIKPIRTEVDYEAVLAEIEQLFEAVPGTPAGDRLEVLTTLVEAYEEKHYPMPLPDPIEAIFYYLESRGLARRDLEPYLGSRARVSEVLNRKRSLSLEMIRRLNSGLRIPAEVLIQSYEHKQAA
jgi:HTH-type transcriptional regulator/antitoxin HigA